MHINANWSALAPNPPDSSIFCFLVFYTSSCLAPVTKTATTTTRTRTTKMRATARGTRVEDNEDIDNDKHHNNHNGQMVQETDKLHQNMCWFSMQFLFEGEAAHPLACFCKNQTHSHELACLGWHSAASPTKTASKRPFQWLKRKNAVTFEKLLQPKLMMNHEGGKIQGKQSFTSNVFRKLRHLMASTATARWKLVGGLSCLGRTLLFASFCCDLNAPCPSLFHPCKPLSKALNSMNKRDQRCKPANFKKCLWERTHTHTHLDRNVGQSECQAWSLDSAHRRHQQLESWKKGKPSWPMFEHHFHHGRGKSSGT